MVAQHRIGSTPGMAHTTPSNALNTDMSAARSVKLLVGAGLLLSGATAAAAEAIPDTIHRYRMNTHALPEALRPGHASLRSIMQPPRTPAAPAAAPATLGRRMMQSANAAGVPPTVASGNATVTSARLIGCPSAGVSAPVTVGGQTFMAEADTGSWTFAVVSNACKDCGVTPTYKPGATAHDQGLATATSYVTGNWSGPLMSDAVAFANNPAQSLKFGAVNATSGFFEAYTCNRTAGSPAPTVLNQAVMGLQPNAGAPPDGPGSYISQLSAATGRAAYAVALCQTGGMFFTGGYDANYSAGPLFYTPLATANESAYVAAPMTGAKLGNTTLNFTLENLGYSLMDTGTAMWLLPPAQFQNLTASVVSATGGVLDQNFFNTAGCKTLTGKSVADVDAIAPKLSVMFATPGSPDADTHLVAYPATWSYLDAQPDGHGNTLVCSMVGSNPSFTIFGAAMMRGMLLEYDYDNGRIGIGPSQNVC